MMDDTHPICWPKNPRRFQARPHPQYILRAPIPTTPPPPPHCTACAQGALALTGCAQHPTLQPLASPFGPAGLFTDWLSQAWLCSRPGLVGQWPARCMALLCALEPSDPDPLVKKTALELYVQLARPPTACLLCKHPLPSLGAQCGRLPSSGVAVCCFVCAILILSCPVISSVLILGVACFGPGLTCV